MTSLQRSHARRDRMMVNSKSATVVLDVLRASSEDEVDLHRIIRLDPALTASVLRAANSTHLGYSRRIPGLRQAIVMLGGTIVISVAASRIAGTLLGEEQHDYPDWLWTHSLAVGCASAVIARRIGEDGDEAFTAGQLHEIGWLVASANGLELDLSDRTHVQIGADLLARWNLPDRIVSAAAHHHDALDASSPILDRIVVAAHSFAAELGAPSPEATMPLAAARGLVGLFDVRPTALLGEIEHELMLLTSDLEAMS